MAASDLKKKRPAQAEPAIRKSFLYIGGGLVGVALLAFILMTVLGGGGGGAAVANTEASVAGVSVTPTPKPAQLAGLKPGGRDPFGVAAPARASTPAPASKEAPRRITPTGDDPVPPGIKQDERTVVKTGLHAWQVTGIGDGVASFIVDKKKVTGVKLGEEVIANYTLIQLRDRCVMIDNGSDRFSVCLGDPPKQA